MKLENLTDRAAIFLLSNYEEYPNSFTDLEENLSLYAMLLKENVIIQRFIQKSLKKNISIPGRLLNIHKEEGNRINNTIYLIKILTNLCDKYGIPYVMTKAFQHFPDMGHDIDLLVLDSSFVIDRLIKEKFEFQYRPISFSSRIAGKSGYIVSGYKSPIEIHHNRLGHFGEYHQYSKQVINRKIHFSLQEFSTFIPSNEDQLIIQCIQRIYGHRTIRISDVFQTVNLLNVTSLDWHYIWSTVSDLGIYTAFNHYLTTANNLYQKWDGKDTFPVFSQNKELIKKPQPNFGSIGYKSTSSYILFKLYFKKVLHSIYNGQWDSIWRFCFLPIIASVNVIQNLLDRLSPANGFALGIKRIFDIIISLFTLSILMPLLLIIAIIIKCDSDGPIFYKGIRTGRNKISFYIFKFRTMVPNAEKIGGTSTNHDDVRILVIFNDR